MSDEMERCAECGMACGPREYHPYAACLMFRACLNPEIVRANLEFIRKDTRPDSKPEYKWSTPAEWRASIGSVDFNMDVFWQAARELKE
ncbi:MAG: hypothetical protein OEV64_13330 [Desulfobulbaceae bacterium]|nr:hypothetical protein [Desulfobulbaceae bacterium]